MFEMHLNTRETSVTGGLGRLVLPGTRQSPATIRDCGPQSEPALPQGFLGASFFFGATNQGPEVEGT